MYFSMFWKSFSFSKKDLFENSNAFAWIFLISKLLLLPIPKVVVSNSPTPSTVKKAASENGDG